ncbi:VOC family protein [Pseudokineococcus basanitobsidens]|uniref:Putative pterin-4-alpha-carbinolamine dehydratase n=1 Tax=Pseudokineococcus basanitobsidens TaxID=1926649 RepID=A0ABU8RFK4_9ACTN
MTGITVQDVADAGLEDWRLLASGLHARFRTADMTVGAALLAGVVAAAEELDHHPDVTLRRREVDVALVSHDVGRVTSRDLRLARRVSDLAAEHGATAQPHLLAEVEVALDTADLAAQGPVWAALLTGDAHAVDGDDVADPRHRVPLLWFQGTDAHATPRQRFHLDVWVPHDVADERIAAAVAAGARVVDDGPAPSFTVLADPEGNRVCVCTALGR